MPKGLQGFQKGHILNKGKNPHGWTDEMRAKLRASHLGKKLSEEHKKKIGLANKGKGRKVFPTGVNHPNWKGGTQTKDHIERIKFRQTMQKQVFERDNYTCQLCGERGIDLQVDHIQEWSEYVELRFSMDNCRTLCAQCHYQITFGKPMPKEIKGWGHNLLERGRLT